MRPALSAGAALMILACALACSGPASPPSSPAASAAPSATPATADRVQIAFAANFDGDGACRKRAVDGCDLWLATYDLGRRSIEGTVRQVSRAVGVSEDFPVLDPQGRFVIFQRGRGRAQHDLAYALVGRPGGGILVPRAREPALSPDGRQLAYTVEEEGRTFSLAVRSLAVGADGQLAVEPARSLTPVDGSTEPFFLPDGEQVAYYRKGDGPHRGQTRLKRLSTGEDVAFSEPDGCAHGAVSPDGLRMFCQNGGAMYARTRASTEADWGPARTLRYPAPQDPQHAGCARTSFGHAEFCASPDVLLATYSCMSGEEHLDDQLMLFTWGGEFLAAFSRQAAASLGRTGEARSGVCIPAPASSATPLSPP